MAFFAMFVPSNLQQDFSKPFNPNDPSNYAEIDQREALDFTLHLASRAMRLERDSDGQVAILPVGGRNRVGNGR